MVSDGGPRDRGQLILIGAVAIAFILLGIVVVFNSVLYTQSIASSDTVGSGVDAQRTELELERGGSRLAQAVNRNNETNATEDLNKTLLEDEGVIWEFASQYGRTKAAAKPTMIDVDNSSAKVTDWGWLVHQDEEGNFTSSTSASNWTVFNDTPTPNITPPEERDIGKIEMTLNVDSVESGDEIIVTLTDNASLPHDSNEISFEHNSNSELLIENDGDTCTLEEQEDDNVTVDLVSGTVWAGNESGDCDAVLDITTGLDSYSKLKIENGDEALGTYEIVVSAENDEIDPGGTSDPDGVEDPNYLAVWSYEFDYRYDTAEVSYSRTIEVDVYGGDT